MTSGSGRTFKFLAGLAAALVLLNYGFVVAAGWALRKAPMRFSMTASGEIDVDVLVVGNSRGVRLMVPGSNESDYSVFNLAYEGLRRTETLALVKDYFDYGNSARFVLIEASSMTSGMGAQCELKSFWSLVPHLEENGRLHCEEDARLASFLPLSQFNTQAMRRAAYYLLVEREGDQRRVDAYRQFVRASECENPNLVGMNRFVSSVATIEKSTIDGALRELERYLDGMAPDATLVIALAPFLLTEATRDPLTQIQRRAAELFSDWNYIDLAAALGPGCDLFADAVHTNTNGIKELRPALDRYIMEFETD